MSYLVDLDDKQYEVGKWGEVTFPNATIESISAHMSDEVKELQEFSHGDFPELKQMAAMECADIALLLLHIAHKYGFSLQDAIRDKFRICQSRKWGTADERGVVRHVEENAQ